MAESILVAAIVASSAAYAAWSLMPRAWRRTLERRFGWSRSAQGCGACSGCTPAPDDGRPVKIVRRR